MKIVILDGFSVNPGDLSWSAISSLGTCDVYERTLPEEVIERAKDADAILTNKVIIRKETIDALPRLKYIGVLATGYNTIDVVTARERGIVVTNIPAYGTDSVVQMVFAHLLNIANRVQHYSEEVRAGNWTRSTDFTFWNTPLIELKGKTMGIVGLGHIGTAVACVATAFGMQVLAMTSKKKEMLPFGIVPVSKEKLFRESDVISLHVPLTDDTRNLVDARTLSWMKPSAILINTGRGPLVNEKDLAGALHAGRIFAAGLDVLSSEPPKADNPLLTAPNCYITPHIAWATKEARSRLVQIATENLEGFISGRIQNNIA